MESLRELYRIGPGPSSSHTVAPQNACRLFMDRYPEVFSFDAELYGSLALTGEGHATDRIIKRTFAPRLCKVTFNPKDLPRFPNGFILKGYDERNRLIAKWTVYSLGGGAFDVEEENLHLHDEIYPQNSMDEILSFCAEKKMNLAEYVDFYEPDIKDHLSKCLLQMLKTVQAGLDTDGVLPGRLKLKRVAKGLNLQALTMEDGEEKDRLLLMSYAYAACEENAAGNTCVTSPTMGASGVIAALMYHYYYNRGISRQKLIKALSVGGIFGNIIKKNATISGAVGGCQAEVGTACAMASAIVAYLMGLSNTLIAYAAEVGIEHHLGLTCDPVGGYVMIPCIERNAVAVLRAVDNAFLARHVGAIKENRVSFDTVVRTMNYTGKHLAMELRETSLGGLAREVRIPKEEKKKETTQLNLDLFEEESAPEEAEINEETFQPEVTVETEAEVVEEKETTEPKQEAEVPPEEDDLEEPEDFSISYDGMGKVIDNSYLAEEKQDAEFEKTRVEFDDLLEEAAQQIEPDVTEEHSFTEDDLPPEEKLPLEEAEEEEEEHVLPEEEKETEQKEDGDAEAFRLEDYDLSLLDSFNTTYKLKEKEKEEVDAFMDKLDIHL